MANALANGLFASRLRQFRQFLVSVQYTLRKHADSAAVLQSSSTADWAILTPKTPAATYPNKHPRFHISRKNALPNNRGLFLGGKACAERPDVVYRGSVDRRPFPDVE